MIPIIILVSTLVIAILAILMYWPTGVKVDKDNNIKLRVILGKGRTVPVDEITVSEVQEGEWTLNNLIRTNGMSLGKINYGRFLNYKTGQKMFLYLTGNKEKVSFTYEGVLYVVDDWRQ